jgi:hypothetical protein
LLFGLSTSILSAAIYIEEDRSMRTAKLLTVVALAGATFLANPAQAAAQQSEPAQVSQVTQIGEEKAANVVIHSKAAGHVIHEPGATYIKVHFSAVNLSPDEFITVSNPAKTEVHTYHGVPQKGDADYTVHGRKGFAALSIDGDTAVVTRSGDGEVHIDGYWRGYTSEEIVANNPGLLSVCSTDARRDVCYPQPARL